MPNFPTFPRLLFLCCLLFFPHPLYAQTDEDYDEIEFPLWIGDKASADYISVKIPPEDDTQYELYRLNSQAIISALTPLVNEETREKLLALQQEEYISLTQLTEIGLEAQFDEENVGIRVAVPKALRAIQKHRLRPPIVVDKSKVQLASPFSASLSLYAQQSWRENQRAPLRAEWQGFANWQDWTLQQRLLYQGENDGPWQRKETRLIRHWPEQMLQLGLGDIQYPRHGLMGSQTLTGLSLATSFDLQPYRIAYPLIGQQFFLEEDAEVSLLVNGSKRHHLKLSAGQHEISDLPLSEGLNEVVLEIEDRLGRRSVLDFTGIHSKQLLAPGLSEYAATLGIPRLNRPDGFHYDSNNLRFSGFYQRGLTSYFTTGGHLETDKTLIMGWLNGGWTGRLGTVDYDLAWSQADDNQAGSVKDWAAQLGYQYRHSRWGIDGNLSWQGEQFAMLGQRAAQDNEHWSAQLSLSPPRLGRWIPGYSYTVRQRWSGKQTRRQRLSVTRHFGRNWYVQVLWSHHQASEQDNDQQIALQLGWTPTPRWRSQLDYSTENQKSRYELRYLREQELGVDMTTALTHTETQRTADLRGQYINNYLETRLDAKQDWPINGGNYQQQALTVSSSLVDTGGEWGLSRPLNGQPFALIKTDNELCGGHIQIKRGAATQTANVLHHPNEHIILPTLNAYYLNPLRLDGTALPIGIDLEKDEIDLFPRAYSGTLVTVTTNRAGYLLGTLLLPSGEPVSYKAGTLHSKDTPAETITDFFTDDTGYFELEASASGDYVLKLSDYQAEISVHQFQCEQIEVELGNITLHEGAEKNKSQ